MRHPCSSIEFIHKQKSRERKAWTGLEPDLCNAGAVLYQLSYQANWELAIKYAHGKPVHIRFICIYMMWWNIWIHIFELRIETIPVWIILADIRIIHSEIGSIRSSDTWIHVFHHITYLFKMFGLDVHNLQVPH